MSTLERGGRPDDSPLVFAQTITPRNTRIHAVVADHLVTPNPVAWGEGDTAETYEATLQDIANQYQSFVGDYGPADAAGFAVACPVDELTETVGDLGDPREKTDLGRLNELRHRGWQKKNLKEDFAAKIGMNPEHVTVRNIAVSAGLAQLYANNNNFAGWRRTGMPEAMVRFGYGIGGSWINQPVRAADPEITIPGSVLAKEWGHEDLDPTSDQICSCGKPGHWEAFASRAGLLLNHGHASEKTLSEVDWYELYMRMAEGIAHIIFNHAWADKNQLARVLIFGGLVLNGVRNPETTLSIIGQELQDEYNIDRSRVGIAHYRNHSPSIGAFLTAAHTIGFDPPGRR